MSLTTPSAPRARTQPRYLDHRVSGRTPTRLEFNRFPDDEEEPQVGPMPGWALVFVGLAAVTFCGVAWFGLVIAFSL